MNLPPDPSGGPVPDDWRDLDDTLADGPAPGEVPKAAKPWLAEQRVMHGLLRALHTADPVARESRVQQVFERIAAEAAAPPVLLRWRWPVSAAAALLLAMVGLWLLLPGQLPTAAAAVDRAVAELARDVARRFRLEFAATDAQGRQLMHQEYALVTQPGARFRVDGKLSFGALQFGDFRLGCDGAEIWFQPQNGGLRRAVPLADRERLLPGIGEALDLGYLDVHDLVRRLPQDFTLRVVAREQDAQGRSVLRITAERQGDRPRARVRSAWLWCDEATGMVTHLEAEVEMGRGRQQRVQLQYLGEEPPGLVDYRKPW